MGAINSLSGPIPGLGASFEAATRAYVAYRNATGGVCGRKVELAAADDGFDGARYRSLVGDLDRNAIGVITGVAGGGDGGASLAEERGIPMTGLPITPLLFDSPVVFGMRPAFADYDASTARFQHHHSNGIRKAAIVFLAAGVTPGEAANHKRLIEAAGIDVVLYEGLPITTISFDSTARAIANSGADYVFGLLDETTSASLARSIAQIRYQLKAQEYPVAYGSNFAKLAGPAGNGASSWIDVLPVEDGGKNPEQAQFIKWMRATAPNARTDVFAELAWTASKAFLDSMEALPGPISREAILAQMRSNHDYDAGGMLGSIDLGRQANRGCLVAVQLEAGSWKRVLPATGFQC